MRRPATADRIRAFMEALGKSADAPCRVYFTGGATAVLEGWRDVTKDVDIFIAPDTGALLRAIPEIKERLEINVELANPADFIPPLPGWESRSRLIAQEGRASFCHYDFYAQALAKTERGEVKDVSDVAAMIERGLVQPARAWELFHQIEGDLYRYPDVSPQEFRDRMERMFGPEIGRDRGEPKRGGG